MANDPLLEQVVIHQRELADKQSSLLLEAEGLLLMADPDPCLTREDLTEKSLKGALLQAHRKCRLQAEASRTELTASPARRDKLRSYFNTPTPLRRRCESWSPASPGAKLPPPGHSHAKRTLQFGSCRSGDAGMKSGPLGSGDPQMLSQ